MHNSKFSFEVCYDVYDAGRYEQLLLEPDPLPAYTLKLIAAMLENNASLIGYASCMV